MAKPATTPKSTTKGTAPVTAPKGVGLEPAPSASAQAVLAKIAENNKKLNMTDPKDLPFVPTPSTVVPTPVEAPKAKQTRTPKAKVVSPFEQQALVLSNQLQAAFDQGHKAGYDQGLLDGHEKGLAVGHSVLRGLLETITGVLPTPAKAKAPRGKKVSQ